MIANVLNRLRPPPPPAAATCPARERVASPGAPCPAPRVCPGCAAAASRRDGHLGQTELFIQFTSLKLQELSVAPGCGRGLCLGTRCSSWPPCLARREAAQPQCQAGSRCQPRCKDRVPRGMGAWLGCMGRSGCTCAHMCPCVPRCVQVCPDVSRCVQTCTALPGTTGHAKSKLGFGVGATGDCTPKATKARVQPCPRHVPRQTRASVQSQVPGVGVPSRRDGGALPGKQEAPPGNEQPRFHSNLKGPQVLPHQRTGCGISGGHPTHPLPSALASNISTLSPESTSPRWQLGSATAPSLH